MKEIVQDGNPVLRATAAQVAEEQFNTPALHALVRDMSEALDAEPEGVALAAPQIGVSLRVFIVRKDRTLSSEEIERLGDAARTPVIETYINPEIVKTSRRRTRADEGCLSVRGIYGTTRPHERVTIKARGTDGSHIMRGAGGLMAQIFEHEINHLNGILFIDHADHTIELKKADD